MINFPDLILVKDSLSLRDASFYLMSLIVVPLLFVFITLSGLALISATCRSLRELSSLKQFNRFVVVFNDGQKLTGNELRYGDGIYNLIKSASSESTNIYYIIYEEKIHHVERHYDDIVVELK